VGIANPADKFVAELHKCNRQEQIYMHLYTQWKTACRN